MSPLATRLLRWAPAVAWMALIFVLSAQPGLRFTDDAGVEGPIRHVVHIVMYAVLAVLLVHAMDTLGWPAVSAAAVALATLYGITDEVHQSLVPDRSGNLTDVVFDAAGAVLGVVVLRSWPRLRERWRAG